MKHTLQDAHADGTARSRETWSRRPSSPWPALAWLLPAAAVLLSLMDVTDLAYLVRTGDVMLHGHEILRRDVFSFTIGGAPWVDQQWGAALVFALVHRAGGWPGLVFLRAGLVAVGMGWTYVRARREAPDRLVAAGATMVCLLVAITLPGALALRSQLLALPLFVASAAILDARHTRAVLAFGLLPIGVIWANVHGSFLMLPLLIGLAVVGDLVDRRPWRRLALIGFGTLLTPLLTPWGVDVYRYVLDLASNPVVRRVVDEWLPLWRQPLAFGAFAVMNAGGIWLVLRRGTARRIELIVGLAIFTVLALWSGRNILWWAVYAGPAYATLLSGWRPGTEWSRRASVVVVGTLVAAVALGAFRVATADPPERLLAGVSSGTADAVRSLGRTRVFAARSASWLELEAPAARYFTDSRVEIFPTRIWDEYFAVVDAHPEWESVLDRWDVEAVAVMPEKDPQLFDALSSSPRWSVVQRDPMSWVFVRSA